MPSLAVWAPTALKDPGVSVNLYDAAGTKLETRPMTLDEASGVWSVTGDASWDRKFYTISLNVYSYATNSIVTNEVTDPYSVSLATDSVRSQFVNLNDADLKPAGWDSLTLPALAAPEDIVLYELHVRDFSIADSSVPASTAASSPRSTCRARRAASTCRQLADGGPHARAHAAGVRHRDRQGEPGRPRRTRRPGRRSSARRTRPRRACASPTRARRSARRCRTRSRPDQLDRPQQITEWMRDLDGFNWGYDPLHFGAPEGSYSTNPNGAQRILEFRRMVKGLNEIGLRTVMDVVYNHTNASGQNRASRCSTASCRGTTTGATTITGNVCKDSCCDDTAAEFAMMEKLMIDTGVTWVRDYKVVGLPLRHHDVPPAGVMTEVPGRRCRPSIPPSTSTARAGTSAPSRTTSASRRPARPTSAARASAASATASATRCVAAARSTAATNHVLNQGFISGWFYEPNAAQQRQRRPSAQALIEDADNIRVWLAGGLASFRFTDASGASRPGADVDYRGQKSGYTKDPQEAINYISKHDNETIWDISQYKHPTGTALAERVRADNVGMSMILLAQGIPFLQAGTEILRSKSMDRNSYDSGDWYNEIDWTLATSKWNQGLPRAARQLGNVEQVKNVILDVTAVQDQAARQAALANFKELLAIRKSSPLFRLRSQAQVDQRVKFFNTGPFQIPGVIAMQIDGCTEPGNYAVRGRGDGGHQRFRRSRGR